MRRLTPLSILALIWPTWAGAVDLDFYTYNAFEETVSAFQRVALVLADPGFLVFVGIFAIAGVLVGALVMAARGIQGQQVNPIGFLIPAVVGVALFRAVVIPTGTIFIYDPVRNATQAVGDVPDVVVLASGLLNKVERGVSDILLTASADPAAERSGALRYSLILNGLGARGADTTLVRNIANYYTDCGLPAMALGYEGVSQTELLRNTPDLWTTFDKFDHPSLSTVFYTGAGDASDVRTCQTAWATLGPQLNDPATLADARDVLCAKSGFTTTDAPQLLRCREELTELGALYRVTPGNEIPYLRSLQLAQGITMALRSGDISVQQGSEMNRQVMAEGMGVAEAMDRWVPKLRGFMTATVLGLVPLVLLFVVTPIMGKALQLLAGLFLWLSLWGVADAVSVSMAADAAVDAFSQMQRMGFSYESFMLSPEAAVQAIGIYGKSRTMALMLATVLSYGLFQFGGYAFSSMAQSWQQDLQQAGERAGMSTMQPEQRASTLGQMGSVAGPEAALANYGFTAAAVAAGRSSMAGSAEAARYIQEDRLNPPVAALPGGAGGVAQSPQSTADGPVLGRTSDGAHAATSTAANTSTRDARYITDRINGSESDALPGGANGAPMSENAATTRPADTTPSELGRVNDTTEVQVSASRATVRDDDGVGIWRYATNPAVQRSQETITDQQERSRIANERDASYAEVSREVGEYRAQSELGREFGRIDGAEQLATSGRTLGRTSGLLDVAATETARDLVSAKTGESRDVTAEGAKQLTDQQNSELMGVIRADPRTDIWVDAAREDASTRAARTQQMERDDSAERIGRTSAINQDISARATETAVDNEGRSALSQGEAFGRIQSAESARAATEAGGLVSTARTTAEQNTARSLAEARVTGQVGEILGLPADTLEGRTEVLAWQTGAQISVAVPEDAGVRENLIARTPLSSNPEAARLLLETPGPASLSFTVGPDGDAGNVRVSVGASASADFSVRENTSVDSITGETVRGGVGILYEPEYLETKLRDAWAPDQDWGDATKLTALAEGIGRAWTQQGIGFSATSLESVDYRLSGGLGVSLGLKSAPSARASGDASASWQSTEAIRADANTQLAANIIDAAREQTAERFAERYGVNWSTTESTSDQFVTEWANLTRAAVAEATRVGREETAGSVSELAPSVSADAAIRGPRPQ